MVESAFGVSLESGGRVYVGTFSRNMVSADIYDKKECYTFSISMLFAKIKLQ
jgi:hypothetical protein